ncbi:MAG: DUF3108 domain-containing protein [Xanthobacteraceae bacterium]
MQPIWRSFARFALIAALGLPAGAISAHSARAQGKLDATYTASLAGIPLGKGAWVVDVGDEQFTAATSGVTTGLLRVFASGQGSGISRGYVSNGTLIPASYAATITASKKTEGLRMTLVGGVIKDLSIDPPSPPQPERIPVTEAHLRGVIDPMTGSLLRVSGTGDVMVPEACGGRTVAIFDGRMRYDLAFAFKRLDSVKADKGYAGPALVCAVYFRPVAGYIPDRPAIKYLIEQRDMEAWLVPIAGTRILAPFRVTIPTPMGTGALQANQFIATAGPPRPTPTSIKGQ